MPKPIYARRHVAPPLPALRMESISSPESTSGEIVTTVFLSNLHCSSCVQTIKDALSSLTPSPTSVDISIVTQSVSVRHSLSLSPAEIKSVIDSAGFDIVATPNEAADEYSSSFAQHLSRLTPLFSQKREKHIEHCSLCKAEAAGNHLASTNRDKLGEDSSLTLDADEAALAEKLEKLSEKYVPNTDTVTSPTSPHQDNVPHRVSLSIGGMTCASCTNAIQEALSNLSGVSDLKINLLGNSATLVVSSPNLTPIVVNTIEDIGYEAEVVASTPVTRPVPNAHTPSDTPIGPFEATLSIGGMTCAACVNTITEILSQIPGASNVRVNLLGKSGTVIVHDKKTIPTLVEAIEDGGYEAEVMTVNDLGADTTDQSTSGTRTIILKVEGMFCAHCPTKVMDALQPFGDHIIVEKPITSHNDPLLRISYVPEAPSFTIRTIIHSISTASTPSGKNFSVSVYKPPTLESKARVIQSREQRTLMIRLLFSFIVAIPTFIIAVVYMSLVPKSNHIRQWFMKPLWTGNTSRMDWSLFFLATPVMFYSAGMFHRRSLREIWALWRPGSKTPIWRRFIRFGSMNLLVSTGVSVAYFSSIALLALAASEDASETGEGDTTSYFDSVVFLTMFLLAGRYLEAYSKGRTADAISALGKLRPTSAFVRVPSSEINLTVGSFSSNPSQQDDHLPDLEKGVPIHADDVTSSDLASKPGTRFDKISAELLEVGDIVRVVHGASPPADGTITSPQGGAFDESSLTGESKLVRKVEGDQVFVGTINKGDAVDVKVDAIGGETMLDHVLNIVREGQTKRAPIERVADLLTGYFVPVVTLLAITTWIIWLALGLSGALPSDYLDINVGGWPVWSLEFAIAVFVVACPCGIGLAAPTALLVGTGLAAKLGILVRGGGEAFQEAAQLDVIVFDKTGTLTQGGEPQVVDARLVINHSQDESGGITSSEASILGIAAEIESASSHPLATAIRQYCTDKKATSQTASDFEETPGRGVKAKFESSGVVAIIDTLTKWKSEGRSVVLLAISDIQSQTHDPLTFTIRAIFAVADPLRPEARSVVAQLQGRGIGTWMVTGDNHATATAVARMVGIPETNVIAGVLPHEKAEKIKWLQSVGQKRKVLGLQRHFSSRRLNERCVVAMVGDGINDAPALTSADVGIAIGSGSDVALSSASFILLSSDLRSLLTLSDLSQKVFNRVKFNFLWATIYNIIAIPIAAGVIYPAGHARLAPVWASLAMALSSVSVVCSSLLLKLYKEPRCSVEQ
ncbi:cation transport ATPase (P-type) family protein [Abortiporus biennis]